MEAPLTYEAAYAELQEILQALENETISVDELTRSIQRANELVNFCQARLKDTEAEISKFIKPSDKEER